MDTEFPLTIKKEEVVEAWYNADEALHVYLSNMTDTSSHICTEVQ